MKLMAMKIITAIAGGALAFFLNYLVASRIGETPYYPGALIYLAIGNRMGLPFGLISAGIAANSLPSGWIQFLPILEMAALSTMIYHRNMDHYRAGIIFWICVGAPFAALTHLDLFFKNPSAFAFAVATYFAGGILNLSLAKSIAGIMQYSLKSRPTLRMRLYDLLVLFTAVPVIVFTVYAKQHTTRSRVEKTQIELKDHTSMIAHELSDYISYNHRSITSMAASLDPNTLQNINAAELFLERQHHLYPAFLTMLIANHRGSVIAGYPLHTENGERISELNIDISDRAYYTEAMRTGAPFMSGVFQGRGFGRDPIVAMSAPLFDDHGEKAGIIEGSLDLSQLKTFGDHHGNQDRATVIVLDQHKIVTFAPDHSGYRALQDVSQDSMISDIMKQTQLQEIFQPMRIWNDYSLTYGTSTQEKGWFVIVNYDLLDELVVLNGQALLFAIVTLILMALASAIAQTFSKKLTEPLRALIAKSQIINTGHPASLEPVRVAGSPREVIQLVDHFETMAARLEKTHSQLMKALDERDRLNTDLKAHNETLDRRVKERTAELEQAKLAAEKADVAKSTFLANMSHEIRTPMNALIGLTEVLAEDQLTDQQKEYIRLIQESSKSLLEIINGILDYSKIEAGKMALESTTIALDPLVQSLVGLFTFSAKEKGLDINLEMDPELPEAIWGDQFRLRQVLSNLLTNAIKFTHRGSVTLKGICRRKTPEHVSLSFQVIDTGIGIPPGKQEDIFKAFEQSDNALAGVYGGTGLGLAISRKLTQMMGGHLSVKSEQDLGSTFTFTCAFPIKILPKEEIKLTTEPDLQFLTTPPRLLIVEDNPVNQKVCDAILGKLDIEYIFANHGIEALNHLERTSFDLILMDCQMPVMDGYEATRKIRASGQAYSEIPIIALTASALSGDKDRCLESGMDDFLSKPFHIKGLRAVISKWLGIQMQLKQDQENSAS